MLGRRGATARTCPTPPSPPVTRYVPPARNVTASAPRGSPRVRRSGVSRPPVAVGDDRRPVAEDVVDDGGDARAGLVDVDQSRRQRGYSRGATATTPAATRRRRVRRTAPASSASRSATRRHGCRRLAEGSGRGVPSSNQRSIDRVEVVAGRRDRRDEHDSGERVVEARRRATPTRPRPRAARCAARRRASRRARRPRRRRPPTRRARSLGLGGSPARHSGIQDTSSRSSMRRGRSSAVERRPARSQRDGGDGRGDAGVPGARLDPAALVLERVRRQPQPAAPGAAEPVEVDVDARRPLAGERLQRERRVGDVVVGVAQRRDHGERARIGAPGERRQRLAGTELGEHHRAESASDRARRSRRSARCRARWSTQYCGSVACSAVIHVPVRFEAYGICGGCSVTERTDVGELVEHRVEQRAVRGGGQREHRRRTSSAARGAGQLRRSSSAGPATTHSSAALIAASDSAARQRARAARPRAAGRRASPRRSPLSAPSARPGDDERHRVLEATARRRGGRRRTRRGCGRRTASGVTPNAIHWRARATDVTNTAGSDAVGRRKLGAIAAGRQQRRQVGPAALADEVDALGAAWRGRRAKRSSSPAPMPTYCEPPPGNMKPRRAGRRPPPDGACGGGRGRAARATASATSVATTTRRCSHRPPTGEQRVRDVGEVDVGCRLEVVGEAVGRVGRRLRRARRQHEDLLGGRPGSELAARGASSTITWALVPPTPSELTPARRGPSLGHGSASPESTNGVRSMSSSGLGAVWLASGGSVRCRSACTTLIRLADAGGRVEVTDVGLRRDEPAEAAVAGARAEGLGERGDLDRVADRGAGAVRLEQLDRRAPTARRPASASRTTSAWPSTLGREEADLARRRRC